MLGILHEGEAATPVPHESLIETLLEAYTYATTEKAKDKHRQTLINYGRVVDYLTVSQRDDVKARVGEILQEENQ